MFESVIPLLLIGLLAWFWQDALRARERARGYCRQLCADAQLQLLDQTVALNRIRLRRGENGWMGFRRSYVFEVSTDGTDRHRGSLSMNGDRLDNWSLPMRADLLAPEWTNSIRH
jgi:Protein of unknown function (DUF3301)